MITGLVRVANAFVNCKNTEDGYKGSINIGSVCIDGENYGIRISKIYDPKAPEGMKAGYRCELKMEVPTSSGLLYVSIGDFNSYTVTTMNEDSIPSVILSNKWLAGYSTGRSDFKSMRVHCEDVHIISADSTDGFYDALEGEIFTHNIVCKPFEVIDDKPILNAFRAALDIFSKPNHEITGIEVLHNMVHVNNYTQIAIPFEQIADLIESFNEK